MSKNIGIAVVGVATGIIALIAYTANRPRWYHITVNNVPYRVIAFPKTKEAWQLLSRA